MQTPWAYGTGYDDGLILGGKWRLLAPDFGALRRDGNAAKASSRFERLPAWRNPGHPDCALALASGLFSRSVTDRRVSETFAFTRNSHQEFRELCMGRDGRGDKKEPLDLLVHRLVKEADISENQARELIELIGVDWSSLFREARFLKGRH